MKKGRKKIMGQEGMTLVEIAVVLAIIGIAAMIAIPSYVKMIPHIDLKNAAIEIADDLMEARMRSISESRDYTLAFDRVADTYTVQPEGGAVGGPFGSEWREIDVYLDASDALVPFFSADDVVMRPNGSAATAGYEAVYVRNNPATAERYRVKVLGVTGKVSVERWRGGSWISAY